ncbi:DUF1501 domain-containing protein [Thiocapsa bogorovii]|uniref:DUF1501 domain-containing protein n=1 Tax=Thiocapsa bogorovii TaxID=521689 RepID=UPI001E55A5F2|nr:DUF1501 domain-containing protein [Thiocapsa bogorovii]UHD15460.1 DUF1501 domain-containing protein [Thiocapsa bogorovii]
MAKLFLNHDRASEPKFKLRAPSFADPSSLDTTPTPFPKNAIGRQLQEAARMLQAGMTIPVFKVRIGSFDAHANQLVRHERFLAQLADALAAFCQTLRHRGHWDRVLVMNDSEFGLRPAENASGGTDHGTAAPHLVPGGRVKGGLYGEMPNLGRLVLQCRDSETVRDQSRCRCRWPITTTTTTTNGLDTSAVLH